MSWLVLIGTLLGGATGSAGAITGQYLAGRAAEKRDRWARADMYRDERRVAASSVLDTGQEIERVASQPDRSNELIHHLWALHGQLALIASDELKPRLDEYADALNIVFLHGAPDGQPAWKYLQSPRARFLNAARSELTNFEPAGFRSRAAFDSRRARR
jgi:hypothetical protein